MGTSVDGIAEIFIWIGFGAGVILGIAALVVHLADGTWRPARAVVEELDAGPVVRWFGDGGEVNQAALSHEQIRLLAGSDMADIFVRTRSRNRMRFTRGNPLVNRVAWLAAGLCGVGLAAAVVSIVLLVVG